MKAVILAGGFGTRIRPLTYLNPKPMLPLVNKPFMHNFISWIKSHDIKDIILSTGYLPEIFENYFKEEKDLGIKMTFVTEEVPLGTCGAVKNVEDHLDNESFMVFNGDVLSDIDLNDMIRYHKDKKSDITIALTPVEDPTSYGLVPLDKDGRVEKFLEKPSWDEITTNLINAGTYIIERKLLDLVPEGENYSFERGLFPNALEIGYSIYGYVSNAYWLDLGTPEKYIQAHQDILNGKIKFDFPGEELFKNIYLGKFSKFSKESLKSGPIVVGENCVIEEGAVINPLTVIGSNCRICKGSHISRSIIFDGCQIEEGCIIKDSILSYNVKIGRKVVIDNNSVIGDNTLIDDGNILKNGIKININSNIKKSEISF
ncbi:MAG: NDP-sugar synthase [Actinomycetota bacterium]|nr:NDP-sugar synthase [Actinomycetota bacterium]